MFYEIISKKVWNLSAELLRKSYAICPEKKSTGNFSGSQPYSHVPAAAVRIPTPVEIDMPTPTGYILVLMSPEHVYCIEFI